MHSRAELGKELIPNQGFQKLNDKGWAVGWPASSKATIEADDAGRYLHINGTNAHVGQKIPLKEDYGRLRLTLKMKALGVELGAESWQNARLTMSFHDASGAQVGGWPNVFGFAGTTGWEICEREYAVPKGAAELRLGTDNLGQSGAAFFRDLSLTVCALRAMAPADVPVPEGITGDPDALEDGWQQSTETRTKISLNGLWRFRPAAEGDAPEAVPPPGDSWGWFRVPGNWPGGIWEFDSGAQKIWIDPWVEENAGLKLFDQGWYKRTLQIPPEWQDRGIVLDFTMLQTHVQAYVDGKAAGELWYPGGELDLTGSLKPGARQELALLVTARPLSKQKLTFMAPDRVFKENASVRFKGITGDLYLCSLPRQKRLADLQVVTSVEQGTISFAAETTGLKPGEEYRLRARVSDVGPVSNRTLPVKPETAGERIFVSEPVKVDSDGRLRFDAEWKDAKIWDTHTPENRYSVTLQLLDAGGALIDELTPVEFGFREIRIQGRDFMLNGKPLHLRLLHNRSTTSTADLSNEKFARTMCQRMFEYGFNALIFGNYDFAPGSVSYIDGLLQACDREGMLVCCSLPHMKDFDSQLEDPATAQRYRELTEWLIRRVRNHPCVIMYAMNHNACGYYGDQNPVKMDGLYELQPTEDSKNKWRKQSRDKALITDAIAKSIDHTRPVYHHQSGNLGDMHTVNIYLNWAPIQERSEWLRHWSEKGVKPLFFVEWGLPHISSWSSYRGPQFIWRTEAFQSLWAAEYAAQFWGDGAYRDDAAAVKALDHEEALWAAGKPFAWSTLNQPLRDMTENYLGVQALFANDNWRSHRAWGISAMLPWDQEGLWKRAAEGAAPVAVPLMNGKQPGIAADRSGISTQFLAAEDGENFTATPLGRVFQRWNMPDCGFIGGSPDFTAKDHTYAPGEVVRKQLVILNDHRTPRSAGWHWRLWHNGIVIKDGAGRTAVGAGSQARVPLGLVVPAGLKDRSVLKLSAVFDFEGGAVQTDELQLDVVKAPLKPRLKKSLWLYDPQGLTAALFDRLQIEYQRFDGTAALPPGALLAIGRAALDKKGLAWMQSLPAGVNVMVFEQSAAVLEGLLGFRVAERGSRRLFRRYPHEAVDMFEDQAFADWRGAATLLPPFLEDLPQSEEHDPLWQWCGFYNTRVWRCGHQGSVASVLIEKPQRGNWRALLDCGFDLQYSPLLECVEAGRHILFFQLDASGRSERELVADRLVVNLLAYLDRTGAEAAAEVRVMGERAGALLRELGVVTQREADASVAVPGLNILPAEILVADASVSPPANLHEMIGQGLKVLCLDLPGAQAARWSPFPLTAVATNACFARISELPPELWGLSNADWAWHGRMPLDAIRMREDTNFYGSSALKILHSGRGCLVLWQVPPWKFDIEAKPYLRTSKRHSFRVAARILGNLGASFETPLLERFSRPIEKAWLHSYYLDTPVAEDDPYRYYRW